MHLHLQWDWVLLLAMSGNIGDPDMIRSLASLHFSGRFTRLHTNVKADGFFALYWVLDLASH
jgi:hypothetical protein